MANVSKACKALGYSRQLFRPTAHRKSLQLARQIESHHNAKIEEFFGNLPVLAEKE
jgi:hypothetical protein